MISAISDRNLSSFPYDLGASGAKNRFFLPNHKDSLFSLPNHKVRGGAKDHVKAFARGSYDLEGLCLIIHIFSKFSKVLIRNYHF